MAITASKFAGSIGMTNSHGVHASHVETIRAIIWDLDETFWHGTLTEGGHVYSREIHHIVITLAKRGIVSSICSKNERTAVERILKDEGIWDYFVFPSIDWTPKGPRVAAIIELLKLRPPSVLFLDDNPMNLAEAQHYCKGIQVADQSMIPEIPVNPLFFGKADEQLSRLSQYKLLEQKHAAREVAHGDNRSFLCASKIRVHIEHDVEMHLDRAIELINRTNQLNFTKIRLSEAHVEARAMLLNELRAYDVNAGLVFASDRYGEYGYIGFYLMKHREGLGRHLMHFCFSCRTLGMDIETWLYRRLGKPHIEVRGDVLTDIRTPVGDIDWLTEVDTHAALSQHELPKAQYDELIVRGGCDVRAVEHYLEPLFRRSFEEMNVVVEGVPIRTDHSIFLRYAFDGVSSEALQAVAPLLIKPEHYTTHLSHMQAEGRNVVLVSFWSDGRYQLYQHINTGILVPFYLPEYGHVRNLLSLTINQLEDKLTDPWERQAVSHLRSCYEYHGEIEVKHYRQTIQMLLSRVPETTFVVFIQTPIFWYGQGSDDKYSLHREQALNEVNVALAGDRNHVAILDPHDFAETRHEYLDFFHFTRPVYQRIGLAIREKVEKFFDTAS